MNKKARREARKAAQAQVQAQGGTQTPEQAALQVVAPKPARVTKSGLPALPTLKRARKPKPAQPCACGCGGSTRGGRFLPGHDARLHGWVLRVERGVCDLAFVAQTDGKGVANAVQQVIDAH